MLEIRTYLLFFIEMIRHFLLGCHISLQLRIPLIILRQMDALAFFILFDSLTFYLEELYFILVFEKLGRQS